MAEEVKNTNEQEVKDVQPEKTEEKTQDNKDQTLGEVLQPKPKAETPKPETVGIDKFLDIKKENKELKRSLKDLQDKIDKGADTEEISEDIDAIAEEFNVEPKFLKKLTKTIESQLKGRIESEFEEKLKPIQEAENAKKADKIFNKIFEETMGNLVDYKDIVNKDVIRKLAMDKDNSNKTLTQLIEETYGNAIGGKRTVETTTPRGGKEPEAVDFARAKRDSEYFKEVMANPETKKEYNDNLANRLYNRF